MLTEVLLGAAGAVLLSGAHSWSSDQLWFSLTTLSIEQPCR